MALVVTIIVLLILLGVTLSLVLGQNGIILLSKDSVDKYNQTVKNELDMLGNLENEIDDLLINIPKEEQEKAFIYLMEIPNDNKTYTINLPTGSFEYDFEVDWGDGSKSEVKSQSDSNKTHTYSQAGEYIVAINGKAQGAIFFKGETRLKALLTGYPSDMNVTQASFYETFIHCHSLTGIPDDLFANTPYVTSFSFTFGACYNLTGIPEGLFANTPNVTRFDYTFGGCINLTGIPENLFANTPNVTDFSYTFQGCSNLTGSIPEGLFANTPYVTNFSNTFSYCSNLTGNALPLWERSNVTIFSNCYVDCTSLANYYSIPAGWK